MKSNRAIVHFDGDSFFASVEQMKNYRIRGKPVITGGERGAATSMSYEAKRQGVGRGMTMRDIRRMCPDAIIVSSDYAAYSVYARRMYGIVRSFTPYVEEYSIDECFADITHLKDVYKIPYEDIAKMMKKKIEESLGLTFGVGLGPNKSLAKVASKVKKPAGFTSALGDNIDQFLKELPIGKIWGIGGATSISLQKMGIMTALDFKNKDRDWIIDHKIAKPYIEIWQELRGEFIKTLDIDQGGDIKSIIKSCTFSPPSNDREYVFSELSHNIENACIKLRRYRMHSKYIYFYLKTQEFRYAGLELSLSLPTSTPTQIIEIVRKHFDKVYKPNVLYRATGISLRGLVSEGNAMDDLFGASREKEKIETVFKSVDQMNGKYGKHTVFLGSSLKANPHVADTKWKNTQVLKNGGLFTLPFKNKKLEIPFLGKVR